MTRFLNGTLIYQTLAKGYSIRTIVSSFVLTLIIINYPLAAGSYFEPSIYRFEDRLTYHQLFRNNYLIDEFTDYVILSTAFLIWLFVSIKSVGVRWATSLSMIGILALSVSYIDNLRILLDSLALISLPAITGSIILNRFLNLDLLRDISLGLTLNYLLISVIILSVFSAFVSVTDSEDLSDPFMEMYILIGRFSPVLLLMLILAILWRIGLEYLLENILSIKNLTQRAAHSFEFVYVGLDDTGHRYSIQTALILGSLMAISVIIVTIPNIDSTPGTIGEDTMTYVKWIRDLEASSANSGGTDGSVGELIYMTFVDMADGDRPFSLLLIYLIYLGLPNVNTVTLIEFVLPAILAPSLILVVYFLTKELTPNRRAILFTCFVTAISFQVVAGIYAGLYSNWIALVITYVSLVFLLRFLKTARISNLILFFISLAFLLFTHGYTWTIAMFFLFLFNVVLFIRKQFPSHLFKFIFAALFCVIVIDLVESAATGATLELTRPIGLTADVIEESTRPTDISKIEATWSNLVLVSQVYLAGAYGNFILLLLALYGTVLIKYNSTVGIFILLFISLAVIPLLFGNKVILSRVLYDIPFQIPVGLAMANIMLSKKGGLKISAIIVAILASTVYFVLNIASTAQNIP